MRIFLDFFDLAFLGLGLGKLFPARESLVSDIPAGDGKLPNLYLQCMYLTNFRACHDKFLSAEMSARDSMKCHSYLNCNLLDFFSFQLSLFFSILSGQCLLKISFNLFCIAGANARNFVVFAISCNIIKLRDFLSSPLTLIRPGSSKKNLEILKALQLKKV